MTSRWTDPIVTALKSIGVMFFNPPTGSPMAGINFDGNNNPVSLQAPDGSTQAFPGAVGPGTGDVNGPASAAIGSFAIYSATTGKLIGELTLAQMLEIMDDRIAALCVAGTNFTSIIYDDAGTPPTLTFNAATQGGGGGGGLPPNGTYGNIVVSGSTPGTIWTIADAQVINSMLAPMAANSVKANVTGAGAPPTDVTLAAFQAWLALVANNLTTSSTVAPSKDAVNTALGTRDAAIGVVSGNLATHVADAANPHAVTKAQVGLGNATNESKATMFTSPVFTGTSPVLGSDAAAAMQAVTLQQLQAAALQVGKRGTARTASVANINLAAPGATLNGVAMVAGDTFLAKDQTAPEENGPYIWNGAAVPATRSPQYDTWVEFPGSQIAANEGTVDADTLWLCVSNDGGTLGVTAINWTKFNIAGALLIVNALSELSGVAGTALTNLGFSAFFAGLRTAANAAALQTAIGLQIGTNVQAFDTTLAGFAGLTIAANQMLVGSGADTPAVLAIAANQFAARSSTGNVVAKAITDFALSMLDDASGSDVRTTIGAQAQDAALDAFAGLTLAANQVIVATAADTPAALAIGVNTFPARSSAGNLAAKAITDFGLSLVDDADAAAGRTTLGAAPLTPTVNAQTGATYSFTAADLGKLVTFANAGGTTVTVDNTLGAAFWCGWQKLAGSGNVTFAASGTTLTSDSGSLVCSAVTAMGGVQANAANVLQISGPLGSAAAGVAVVNAFSKQQYSVPVALTDAATIVVDASLSNTMFVTLGGNRALGIPSNAADGMTINMYTTQDGTGSRTLTPTTGAGGYAKGAGQDWTASTAIGAVDLWSWQYNSRMNRWVGAITHKGIA